MQPAILVADLGRALLGAAPPMSPAFAVHLVSGVVLFPIGYLLFRAAAGIRSPALAGLLWGAILWLVAQALLAPLAGRPFMLGFGAYARSRPPRAITGAGAAKSAEEQETAAQKDQGK